MTWTPRRGGPHRPSQIKTATGVVEGIFGYIRRGPPLAVPAALRALPRDARWLFATRFVRLFAYGSLSVVLVFYLVGIGLSEPQIGMLLTLTLVGDTVVSLYLTTRADRIGRRRMLMVGALLMAAAGLVFASTRQALAARARGNRRRHQPERQRGRTVPVDRAGRAVARRHRSDQDRGLRLVHARGIAGDGARRAGRRHGHARRCKTRSMAPVEQLPDGRDAVRRARRRCWRVLFSRLSPAAEAPTLGEQKAFQATLAGSRDSADRATSC